MRGLLQGRNADLVNGLTKVTVQVKAMKENILQLSPGLQVKNPAKRDKNSLARTSSSVVYKHLKSRVNLSVPVRRDFMRDVTWA